MTRIKRPMRIDNKLFRREIYKHIYSFMPGFNVSTHSKMIKAVEADNFKFWIERYEVRTVKMA